MTIEELRERCYSLSERFSWLGVGADIPTLSLIELEALYRFLVRVASE